MANPYTINPLGGFNVGQALSGLGQQFGQMRQQEEQKRDIEDTRAFAVQAQTGDPVAMRELFARSPQLATQIQQVEQDRVNQMDAKQKAIADDANFGYAKDFRSAGTPEEKMMVAQRAIQDPASDLFDQDDIGKNPEELALESNILLYSRLGDKGYQTMFGSDQGISKDVQSSKILDDGTVIQVMRGGDRQVVSPTGEVITGEEAKSVIGTARDQAHKRKIQLKRLDQTIKKAQQQEDVLNDQQKAIQRGNIQRLGTLSNTSSGRGSAIQKATKFKKALESGQALSGAGRKAASFVPGVYSSQGQFDEEFNAFSEVAARQQLKASGETRPTDADVQGMKQAMFGVGRDEAVNVQLLNDFIKDQQSQNKELDQLIEASRGGNLSGFTFTPEGVGEQKNKTVNWGDLP